MSKKIWSSSLQRFIDESEVEKLFGYKGPRQDNLVDATHYKGKKSKSMKGKFRSK